MQPRTLYTFLLILAGSLIVAKGGMIRDWITGQNVHPSLKPSRKPTQNISQKGGEGTHKLVSMENECGSLLNATNAGRTLLDFSWSTIWKFVPSWGFDFYCLHNHTIQTVAKLLDLVDDIVQPCRFHRPWESLCNPNASYDSTINDKGYVSPVKWPCFQRVFTVEKFYNKLRKVYVILNPCASAAPVLSPDLKNNDPNQEKALGKWVYALWWFWWYFLSRQVLFHLATSLEGEETATIYDDGLLFNNGFDKRKPTKIIIHGFFQSKNSNMEKLMRIAYYDPHGNATGKAKAKVNLISVNWSSLSHFPYLLLRYRLIMVAKQIESLVKRLVCEYKVPLRSIHLIGHSLGAHIAGMTGNLVAKWTVPDSKGEYGIGRVTGLDPASPGFGSFPDELKIGRYSGRFVDVIHTSALVVGYIDRLGHADFYVNSGMPHQPGCGLGSVLGIGSPILDFDILCSHSRAYFYYAESIVFPKAFISRRCSTFASFVLGLCNWNPTTYMGEETPPTARGAFYLNTASKPLFGLGEKGI